MCPLPVLVCPLPEQHAATAECKTRLSRYSENMETVKKLLETFQECVARGDQASLFLETRNGNQFANFSVKMPVTKPGTFKNKNISRSRKSPSTVRRDKLRLEKYLQRKTTQGSWSPAATSTPEKESSPPNLASCSQNVETTVARTPNFRPGLSSSSKDVRVTLSEILDEAEKRETKPNDQGLDQQRIEKENEKDNNIDDIKINEEKIMTTGTGTQWHTVGSPEFEEFCEKMQNKFLKNIIQIKNGEEPNETKEDDKDDNIEGAKNWAKLQKQSFIKK